MMADLPSPACGAAVPPPEPIIMLVDDDPGIIQATSKALRGLGRLRFATNGVDALRLMLESTPDLVLLDSVMPGMSGLQVLEAIKANSRLAHIPVIFLTSHTEDEFERQALEAGAVDFIPKPIRPEVVLARARAQLRAKHSADRLMLLAHIDGLTGVGNRRYFDKALGREVAVAKREGQPLSLLMLDVDHFKRYNDHYGHLAGDACLKSLAQAICGSLMRVSDLVFRFGGEEFAVILPNTQLSGALEVGERILEAVRDLRIEHVASECRPCVTLSIGVATCSGANCFSETPHEERTGGGDGPYATALLALADSALYQAKFGGRDRVAGLSLRPLEAVRA